MARLLSRKLRYKPIGNFLKLTHCGIRFYGPATMPLVRDLEDFLQNDPAQAGRANGVQLPTETQSRPCLEPDGYVSWPFRTRYLSMS